MSDRELQEAEYRQHLKDIRDTFGSDHGKRVLLYLLEHGLYHQSAFTGNSKTYWNCGVQDYVRQVIIDEVMAADFDIYANVLKQLTEKKKVRKKHDVD